MLITHQVLIGRFGGQHGLRDENLLDSALAQPESRFGGQFLHVDLHHMAAAYLYHLVQNHPFLDGNKRVGYTIMRTFLIINGLDLTLTTDARYDLAIRVAEGIASKTEVVHLLRNHTR
ncbi:MAG: type II toxin-antitoxin system death-on-curing family toxin [Trueperaceae bacterium]